MKLDVMPVRERAGTVSEILRTRLDTILKPAMRATGIDMWVVLCQEDNPDPVYTTLIPMDTWSPILQVLVFYDPGGEAEIERYNVSGVNTHDLYQRPYAGQLTEKQWPVLIEIVTRSDPTRIGINIGDVQWAGGGLTHNLYKQLRRRLPDSYVDRLVSAEMLSTLWLSTLTAPEINLFEQTVAMARTLLAHLLSPSSIEPGVTTTDDLVWEYWQVCADNGLDVSFKPFFSVRHSPQSREAFGADSTIIQRGDLVHSDVGIKYCRLNSDHQELAYVLTNDEAAPPDALTELLHQGNRLQDIFLDEFKEGMTGNELLAAILSRARNEGVPKAKVYSHSLGRFLHEPGPLIGLPWEQEWCIGRGDVRLGYDSAFAMELSVTGPIDAWSGEEVTLSMEQDVVFTRDGCRVLNDRQTEFHLV